VELKTDSGEEIEEHQFERDSSECELNHLDFLYPNLANYSIWRAYFNKYSVHSYHCKIVISFMFLPELKGSSKASSVNTSERG
jgi:hypothetical protein